MYKSFSLSLLFHFFIILFTMITMPFVVKKPIDVPPIIAIDLIQISDKTQLPFAPKAKEIIEIVQKEIGAIAKPDKIYVVDDLPKTRSGKIMRRVLKKIIAKDDLGDISTLVNPEIISKLKDIICQ